MQINVNLEWGIIHLSGWRGSPHSNITYTSARLFASANRHPECRLFACEKSGRNMSNSKGGYSRQPFEEPTTKDLIRLQKGVVLCS